MNKFWTWVTDSAGGAAERTLHLEGAIASESWFDDEVTPAAFKEELMAASGPVTLWINSPGGDVFAAGAMVLSATMGDLDRAHYGREPPGFFPVPTGGNAVKQA